MHSWTFLFSSFSLFFASDDRKKRGIDLRENKKQNIISSSWLKQHFFFWCNTNNIAKMSTTATKTHLQTTQDTPLAFLQRFLEYKNQRKEKLIPPRVLNDEEEAEPFTLNIFDFDGTLFRSPEPNPMLWSKDTLGKLLSTPHQQGNAPFIHFFFFLLKT